MELTGIKRIQTTPWPSRTSRDLAPAILCYNAFDSLVRHETGITGHGRSGLPLMLGEDRMDKEPTQANVDRMWKFARTFADKSGTSFHPAQGVTEVVIKGLALHQDELGKPLCPCNFYPDKAEEVKNRRWICACDEMQIYKYCHCLLFVREDGLPITEYLPEDHEGRQIYGVVEDPTPEKGRALRHRAGTPSVE